MPAVRTQRARKEKKPYTRPARKEKKEMKPKLYENMHPQLNGTEPIFSLHISHPNEANSINQPKVEAHGSETVHGLSAPFPVVPAQPTVLNAKKPAFKLPKRDKNGDAIHYVFPNIADDLSRLSVDSESPQTSSSMGSLPQKRSLSGSSSSNTSSAPVTPRTTPPSAPPTTPPSTMHHISVNNQGGHPTLGSTVPLPQQMHANPAGVLQARQPQPSSTMPSSRRPTSRHIAPSSNPRFTMPNLPPPPQGTSDLIDPMLTDSEALRIYSEYLRTQHEYPFPSGQNNLPSTSNQAPRPYSPATRQMQNYYLFPSGQNTLPSTSTQAPRSFDPNPLQMQNQYPFPSNQYTFPSTAAQAPVQQSHERPTQNEPSRQRKRRKIMVQNPTPPPPSPSPPSPKKPDLNDVQQDVELRAAYPFELSTDWLEKFCEYPSPEEQPGIRPFSELLATAGAVMDFADAGASFYEKKDPENEVPEN